MLGGVLLLAVSFALAYHSTVLKLTEYWWENDTYSYGFLVPIISGYLIWVRRKQLASMPADPSLMLGVPVLAAALIALVVGRASSTNLLEELSIPIAVWGITLLVAGPSIVTALMFPLAYLLAMVPFWDFVTNRLHEPFQLYSAIVGIGALRLFDIPVMRDGVFIYLPNITLEVAEVCSGVNNLVAVLCIGVPMTHLHVKSWPRRIFILASSIGIALLSNGVRVAGVSLFAYYGIRGADGDIHGPFSLLRSMFISAVGFVALLWLIGRFSDATGSTEDTASNAHPSSTPLRSPTLRVAAAGAIGIGMFLAVAAFGQWHRVDPIPLTANLNQLPRSLGGWRMAEERPSPPAVRDVGFDQVLSRRYVAQDGAEMELLVGYFEAQRQGKELVGFELSRLIPAGNPQFITRIGDRIRMKDFLSSANGQVKHVSYCYVLNGRFVTEGYEAKWWTTWNTLTARRSDGGFVLIAASLRTDETIEQSRSRIHHFIAGVVPGTSSGQASSLDVAVN
jgi:EpsI family protein